MIRSLFRSPGISAKVCFADWPMILTDRVPLLSIEITRERPLSWPGLCLSRGALRRWHYFV